MNATANLWYQLAAETDSVATLQAEMEPYLALIVARAAEGAPGELAERIRNNILEATDRPSPKTATRRLAAALCDELHTRPARIVTRDTILVAETLPG